MEDLFAHVRALCTTHRIRLKFHKGDRTEDVCSLKENWIRIRRITNRARYAVALHEIGHLCSKTLSHPRLYQEGAAWAWAREHALCWTPSMERTMLTGLRSYLDAFAADFEQALPGQLRAPPRTHPFWQLLKNEPKVRELFAKTAPFWFHPNLLAIPWGAVLSHPERPRCANCAYWRHLTENIGECLHKDQPLGVEFTPKGALCGTRWVRSPLPLDTLG